MNKKNGLNERLSSKIEIEFPDFTKLPERVKQKFESLPTKVNFFRMMGYSPGTFVEIIDLKATFLEGIKHNVTLPFNALSSTELFNSMGKEKPD